MNNSSEIYPNSPLMEVVCEVRFDGNLEIVAQLHKFQKKINEKYSNLLVPKVSLGSAISLEPYRFESKDGNSGVNISLNKFSYYEKKYSGHVKFIKEFNRLISILNGIVRLKDLNRVGWRYINLIPFSRLEENIPLNDYLNVSVHIPTINTEMVNNISLVLMSAAEGGQITTKIESVISNSGSDEALVLDFDYSATNDLKYENLATIIDSAHRHTRNLFEEIITEKYRQYLKGEEI